MGQFVGMLLLIAKRDLPLVFGVFIVINFSFGTSLYFALVANRFEGTFDVLNNNATRFALHSLILLANISEVCLIQ